MQEVRKELQQQISEKEAYIQQVRNNILLQWVSHLFTSPHRCILTAIAASHSRNHPLLLAEVEKFKNGSNLLTDLEGGLMVTVVRKEKGVVELRLNRQFFTLLPTLVENLAAKLDPTIARLRLFSQNSDLWMCRGCQQLRKQNELNFLGQFVRCNCQLSQFEQVFADPVRLAFLSKIREMLVAVLSDYAILEKLTSDIRDLNVQLARLSRRQLSEYEQFIRRFELEKAPKINLEMSGDELRKTAFDEVTGLMRLRKVEELAKVRIFRGLSQFGNASHDHKCISTFVVENGQVRPTRMGPSSLGIYSGKSASNPGIPVFAYEPVRPKLAWAREEYRVEELEKEVNCFQRQFNRKWKDIYEGYLKLESGQQDSATTKASK